MCVCVFFFVILCTSVKDHSRVIIVIVNSTMVDYCRPDVACVRISSDTLWEVHRMDIVIFHEERNTLWKTIADG